MITLRPDQAAIAGVARQHLAAHRGCLLAEDVGRGKTFIALAVAATMPSALLVVPASLRATWRRALEQAGMSLPIVSHESLSRNEHCAFDVDLVIVDESHRFRNPATQRHRALSAVCASSRVLLLSATPVHNRADDLVAQLALFLGERASLCPESLSRTYVVRSAGDDRGLPRIASPVALRAQSDEGDILEAILALPAPPRPADGGEAGILRAISLVRAWSSSRAALVATLTSRRRSVTAIEQSLSEGRLPTARELRAWDGPGDDIQLGFAALLAGGAAAPALADALAPAVSRERDALDRLGELIAREVDPDLERVRLLLEVLSRHAPARVVAFTEWASTARRYFHLLRHRAGLGLLTADRATISSGRISRDELLDRFAPQARGAREPPARERVSLLIATDLLSEGVNLQDASVVVHLDLPWNPQRMAQRVGRARRPGGADVVHAYCMFPPARAELLLDVESRLARKLDLAERVIGRSVPILPALLPRDASAASPIPRGDAEWSSELQRVIRSWRCDRATRRMKRPGGARALIAACHAQESGWLAVFDDGSVVATIGDTTSQEAEHLVRAARACSGIPRSHAPDERRAALLAVGQWKQRVEVTALLGWATPSTSVQHAMERRIRLLLSTCSRHERPAVTRAAQRLRDALARPIAIGAERRLEELLASRCTVATALEQLESLAAALPSRGEYQDPLHDHGTATLVALIMFGQAPC